MEEQRIATPDLAYQEMIRRAARRPLVGSNHWAQYVLLLEVCQEILSRAPRQMEDLDATPIEEMVVDGLADLAETVALILPGGLTEFQSYLSEVAARRRARRITQA